MCWVECHNFLIPFEINLESKIINEDTFDEFVVFRENFDQFIFDTIDHINIILSEMNDDSIGSAYV